MTPLLHKNNFNSNLNKHRAQLTFVEAVPSQGCAHVVVAAARGGNGAACGSAAGEEAHAAVAGRHSAGCLQPHRAWQACLQAHLHSGGTGGTGGTGGDQCARGGWANHLLRRLLSPLKRTQSCCGPCAHVQPALSPRKHAKSPCARASQCAAGVAVLEAGPHLRAVASLLWVVMQPQTLQALAVACGCWRAGLLLLLLLLLLLSALPWRLGRCCALHPGADAGRPAACMKRGWQWTWLGCDVTHCVVAVAAGVAWLSALRQGARVR